MQESRPQEMSDAQAKAAGRLRREFFEADNQEQLVQAMDDRKAELEAIGEVVTKRKKIGRNDPCPCGSGRKFKKCCITGLRRS